MIKKVITTMNTAAELVPLIDAERFVLYQKKEAQWQQTDVYELPNKLENTQLMRNMISSLSSRFEDCRVIVSRKISGIAYQALNQSGFAIFEADVLTHQLLDDVISDMQTAQTISDKPPLEPFSPQNDGNYFLDLTRLQEAHPEISSKKALMGFMQTAAFFSLELVCDHLPPWMEDMMKERGMAYRMQQENGKNRVFISGRTCREGD